MNFDRFTLPLTMVLWEVKMATIEELQEQLAALEEQGNLEGVRKTRELFLQEHGDDTAAAEIFYKSGLDALFNQHDLKSAMEYFASAIALKDSYWSAAARISQAIGIYRQGDIQKALFELRKAAYPEEPNGNSIAALAFIEYIFEEQNNQEELQRTRKDRISQLKALAKEADPDFGGELKGFYLKELGQEYIRNKDTDLAAKRFNEALALGEDVIGSDLFAEINDLMP